MLEESLCSICSATADGIHYGALSCRSCNAFFRRTVVEKVQYYCKNYQNCIIDMEGRCSCRFCRYKKCLEAGMRISAVQPRRDPTGSQRDRQNKISESSSSSSLCSSHLEDKAGTPHQRNPIKKKFKNVDNIKVKTEIIDQEDIKPSTSNNNPTMLKKICKHSMNYPESKLFEEYYKFNSLIDSYKCHLRMMQLSFSTIPSFLDELENGPELREMTPFDMNKLYKVELVGVFFWLDRMECYKRLPSDERDSLLKRYSIRKLNLDHFYIASQHPTEVEKRNFVLNNSTFIPPNRTGFEMPEEDEKQIKFKYETFAETYSRGWKNIVNRFVDMAITDAEIVYLHLMLLWSVANNPFVSAQTKLLMKEQRNWAMQRLFESYTIHQLQEAEVRFAEITLILGDIEEVCNMHCLDIQIFKVFGFCDLGNTWYADVCYSKINNPKLEWDVNMAENLKKLTFHSIAEGIQMWKSTNNEVHTSTIDSNLNNT